MATRAATEEADRRLALSQRLEAFSRSDYFDRIIEQSSSYDNPTIAFAAQ
jgi:hypothetical protein